MSCRASCSWQNAPSPAHRLSAPDVMSVTQAWPCWWPCASKSRRAAERRAASDNQRTPDTRVGKIPTALYARRPGATARATRAFYKRSRLFRTPGRRCLFQQPALRISAPRTILLALPSLPACRSKCTALVARTSFRRTSVIATQLEDFCMSRLGMVHPLYFALWRSTARCGARGRIS